MASSTLFAGKAKIYWGNYRDDNTSGIWRMNPDGSGTELVIEGYRPWGNDVENNHVYWSQGHSLTGMIRRANFDGTGITTIFANVDSPRGIALDVENGKMYWATNADGTGASWLRAVIRRSNLDGTNVEILLRGENAAVAAPLTEYFASPGNIALDKTRGFLYVGGVRIFKLATDASSCVRIIPDAGGIKDAWGLYIYIPPSGTLITTF